MAYQIILSSDTAYEELIAEIMFGNGEMVVVSQERSTDQFEVSMYSRHRDSGDAASSPLTIDFETFLAALDEAKQKLISFSDQRA